MTPLTHVTRSAKLHLGCGTDIKEGWVNHDMAALPGVDVVHDLRVFPWPFEDGEFSEVRMKDVLEHLQDTCRTMDELYRITSPGATVYISVPYWNSNTATGDPTHVKFFNEYSFQFFDPEAWQCQERPYYSKARFHVRRLGVWFTTFEIIGPIPKLTRDFVFFNPIIKKVLLTLSAYFGNVVSGLEFHLERVE